MFSILSKYRFADLFKLRIRLTHCSIFIALLSNDIVANEWLSWTDDEILLVESLVLDESTSMPPLNPSNIIGNDYRAKQLGRALFFDTGLSSTKDLSCESCHIPAKFFTDGLKKAKGINTVSRNTPTIVGIAHSSWFYFDGRRDSLWSQTITPLESLDEMGGTRSSIVKYFLQNQSYVKQYSEIFGSQIIDPKLIPDDAGPYGTKLARKKWRYLSPNVKYRVNRVFANIGRLLAAYVRELQPPKGKLESFYSQLANEENDSVPVLTEQEQLGLKLFIDFSKTQCLNCHNGPLFTNGVFHNIGTANLGWQELRFWKSSWFRSSICQ